MIGMIWKAMALASRVARSLASPPVPASCDAAPSAAARSAAMRESKFAFCISVMPKVANILRRRS